MSNEAIRTLEFIASNDGNFDQKVAKRALELIRAFDAFDTQAEAPSDGAIYAAVSKSETSEEDRKAIETHLDAVIEHMTEAPPPADLTYTNYQGKTSVRHIIPRSVRYGTTQWHPEPQWLLLAYDCDKKADREFALKDFGQPASVQLHAWIKSPLGHGEVMCSRCCITNREAAVLGRLNECT
jgi:hypothetical protein